MPNLVISSIVKGQPSFHLAREIMRRVLNLILMVAATLIPVERAAGQSALDARVSLQPGDVLKVEVWREGDLSGEFLVDESGVVTLPLLGPVSVIDVPIAELRDSLLADYRRELRNPSIVITPLRRVYVLGEVNQPGLRAVDPTVTLGGVIALAGGANGQGDLRKIQVFRNGELIQDGVPATSMLAALDVRSGDQIFIGQRGWFERNSTFVISALLSVTGIIITLVQ